QRGNGRRVPAADDQHVRTEIWMRLTVIMLNLPEVLTGNGHYIRQIVKAGSNDNLAGVIFERRRKPVAGCDREVAVGARNLLDVFILANVKTVELRHFPVVFQSFGPRRLLMRSRKRNLADLEQLGCREKNHVRRIVVQRVDKATLVDVDGPKPQILHLYCARETSRTRTNDHHIKRLHHSYRLADPSKPRPSGGMAIHYLINGKLMNGMMSGSWNHDSKTGNFKLTDHRQSLKDGKDRANGLRLSGHAFQQSARLSRVPTP